ncbi:hypothetical protein BH09MYX1_BH09MYX1_47050 [soil metagenome]
MLSRAAIAESHDVTASARRFAFPARYDKVSLYVFLIDRNLRVVPRREEVRVALAEGISNAILHGVLGVPSLLRNAGDFEAFYEKVCERERAADQNRRIDVTMTTVEGGVEIVIADGGGGFAWARRELIPGRGLSLLHLGFDRVSWNASGNEIRLFVQHGEL